MSGSAAPSCWRRRASSPLAADQGATAPRTPRRRCTAARLATGAAQPLLEPLGQWYDHLHQGALLIDAAGLEPDGLEVDRLGVLHRDRAVELGGDQRAHDRQAEAGRRL